MNNTNVLSLVATTLIISIAIMLICREIVCWYWKINKTVLLQEKILAELEKLNGSRPKS
jgi:hypothetical protein